MKLRELKSIICVDEIIIYVHGTSQRFCKSKTDNDFTFWKDDNISLWDIYGNDEIDKIYIDYISSDVNYEVICIDLK